MTEPPSHDPAPRPAGADPTRDFRWSPLPDVAAARSPVGRLVDEPTDELNPPRRPRERTIAFASPDMGGGRPAPTIGPRPRPRRRWPWVVLTLVPIVVIVAAGIALVVLLRAG
jgi:hypothetical protein